MNENNEQPNATDTPGKEPDKPVKDDTKPVSPPVEPQPISPLLDRAEAANKEKATLLEREEKLTERKEKLHALQMVGGHTQAGQASATPEEELQKKGEEGAKEIVDAFR